MRFYIGTRTPLEPGLEVIHFMFWQRICLHFVCVLKLCGRLNLNGCVFVCVCVLLGIKLNPQPYRQVFYTELNSQPWEIKLKGDTLINLMEEISRQHSILAVALLLLLAKFTVRNRSKIWKMCTLTRKKRKLWTKRVWLSKRPVPLKRSQAFWTETIRKMSWGLLRNWSDPTHCRVQGTKL
jgi:hypothetical protein